MVFWMIFGSQKLPKWLKHHFCENLKNSDFPWVKLIFSRFRRLDAQMNIDQKIAKIKMFFGHRFWLALGQVLKGVGEAKNVDFCGFLNKN